MNPISPLRLSASTVASLQCPHRFHELNELRNWPAPPSAAVKIAANRGRAVHAVLASLYHPAGAISLPDLSRMEVALDSGVPLLRLRPEDHQAGRALLRELAAVYVAQDTGGYQVKAVEQRHEITLTRAGVVLAFLEASADRIQVYDHEPNQLVVIDIASGRKTLHPWSAWLSLAVARARWPGYSRHAIEVHTVSSDGVEVERLPACRFKGISGAVTEAVAGYLDQGMKGDYPARTSEMCLYCPLKPSCALHDGQKIEVSDLDFDEIEPQ